MSGKRISNSFALNAKARDGISPWLDNGMDSISCDDTGRPVSQQSVSTNIALHYGNTPKSFTITGVTRNGSTSMGTGVTISPSSFPSAAGTSQTFTVTYATTATITGKDKFVISLQASDDSSVTRQLTFTVNGIIGDVYNLKPSASQLNVSSDATTASLSCGYTKNVNGTVTEYPDETGVIDGKYRIFFRRRVKSTGSFETSYILYSGTGSYHDYARSLLSSLDVLKYDAVEFCLSTSTSSYAYIIGGIGSTMSVYVAASLANVIDRETVPVFSDGAGVGANLLDGTGFVRNMSKWTIPGANVAVVDGGVNGQKAFRYTGIDTKWTVLRQNDIWVTDGTGKLRGSTWYTLSYYIRGNAGRIGAGLYSPAISNGNAPLAFDQDEKRYVDGVEMNYSGSGIGMSHLLTEEWTRHVETFKTAASLPSGYVSLYFRTYCSGIAATVERNAFTAAQWDTYGAIGHSENWTDANSSGTLSVGDTIVITGTTTDTGVTRMLTYLVTSLSGSDARGECTGNELLYRDVCCIKLEEGRVATEWCLSEADKIGDGGSDGISRWLVATPSAVSFRSDATGSFSSNAQVTVACAVWKRVGSGNEQLVTAENDRFDGLCLRMRRRKSDGSWYDSAWLDSAETNVTWALAINSGVTAVEFRLSRSVGASSPYTPDGIVASLSVLVTCDGRRGAPGESITGSPGVSYIPMGRFDPATEYTRDNYTVPVVFYDDGTWNAAEECYGHYYELTVATNLIGGTYYKPGDTYGGTAVWTVSPNYSLVIARGLIAPYGKVGKGIFCGDFFYSAEGRVGTQEYAAGATIGSRPAYARFTGDPGAEKSLKTFQHGSSSSPVSLTAGVHTVASVYLAIDTVFHFYFEGRKGSSSSVDFVLRDPDGDEVISWGLLTFAADDSYDYTASRNGYYTLQLELTAANTVYLYAEYRTQGVFEPNWWVNLLTGKMSAARENFVVDSEGNVFVKGEIQATSGYFSGTLSAAVYDYKVYFHSAMNPATADTEVDIPADADYFVCKNVATEYLTLPYAGSVAGKQVIIKNPFNRTYDNVRLMAATENGEGLAPLLILDGVESQTSGSFYPIGNLREIKLWADGSRNQWRILDEVAW
mgnify:FL=1